MSGITLNIIAYFIYSIFTIFLTLKVGYICYKNGEIYLFKIFSNNQHIVKPLNVLLLVGYYLVNIGYALFAIGTWGEIVNKADMLSKICEHIGQILLLLGVLHYFNMLATAIVAKINFQTNIIL